MLARIDEAETEADLKTVADLAGKIADPLDKQFAREAFAARLQAMREAGAGPQTDPDVAEAGHEPDAAE
ncbi:hypothetical protein [Thiobaca trueperi]|uniref:hypothetical protein n=1 Tax=Thiobaca trueperi TaxID=127458 RepID=UPI0014053071|nr:hypothetical protein [Thiobaca trueperi]